MVTRRNVLVGISAAAAVVGVGGVATASSFRSALARARQRIASQESHVIASRFGELEYAVAGQGAPVLMIHGTGGGFDQGLFFANALTSRGYQVIAPSRFGYLRSTFPEDPSSENQADAFVDLLDHFGIERLPVAGGSAGALSAMQFAIRHPERCSALLPIVPAAYSPGLAAAPPPSAMQRFIIETVLRSDFLFWVALNTIPDQMTATLLATDPALIAATTPAERERADRILWEIFPVSSRAEGLLNDARLAGNPAQMELSAITAPTLTISVDDDRFGTDEAARYIAAQVPGAKLIIYPTGGHIWIGHDEELWGAIDSFIQSLASNSFSA